MASPRPRRDAPARKVALQRRPPPRPATVGGAAAQILSLQRAAGNVAVRSLLRDGPAAPDGGPSVLLPAVQRCGDHPCDCPGETERPVVQRLTDAEKAVDLLSGTYAGDARLEAAFDHDPPMRTGESGDAVRKVQRGLMDDGFVLRRSVDAGGPDGVFGSDTRAAVRAFQRKHGLRVDGRVGRETLGRLDELASVTGGVGRGGGGAERPGDTGFEIRGKDPAASGHPTRLFFTRGDATLDADERAKVTALATPADRALTLRGLRSEDEAATLAATRVAAADAQFGAAGHTGTRTPDPRPDAGLGRITYRAVRIVEVVPAGATASTPDCSAGPAVAMPPPNPFTTANTRALAMLDTALAELSSPTPTSPRS